MSEDYLTVTAVTRYLKRKLELDRHLTNIWLKGEISNFNHHSRGHMYLTLKDENTRIQAVMFLGRNRTLTFLPENGMNVLVKGQISIYERNGQYQLYIHEMEPDGLGSLFAAFEQLKKKLDKAGYFSAIHKQSIPMYPNHIGVVTSPTGAAIKDILTTLKRRYPYTKVTIFPVTVQGKDAAPSIVRGIEQAHEQNDIDTLIVGRGGGSLEDLWAFNEEIVAKAIFQARIPIISAVGHETDTTISDFVADLRAPTPTSAAELATPNFIELKQQVHQYTNRMNRALQTNIQQQQHRIRRLDRSYLFRFPEQLTRQKEQHLDQLVMRIKHTSNVLMDTNKRLFMNVLQSFQKLHPKKQLKDKRIQFQQTNQHLEVQMKQYVDKKQQTFTMLLDKLMLLNPLEVMKRGFAIPYNDKSEFITSVQQVQPMDDVRVNVQDGTLHCVVKQVEEKKHG